MTDQTATTSDDGLWPSARWELALKDPLTPEIIWARLAEGEPLKEICKSKQWPYSFVVRWKNETEERRQRYNAALADWGDALAQEAVLISDTTERGVVRKTKADGSEEVTEEDMLGHRKLRIETRFKLAAKLDRERYGDSVALTGKGGGPLQFQDVPDDLELARRLAYILTTANTAIDKAADSSREAVQNTAPVTLPIQEDNGEV